MSNATVLVVDDDQDIRESFADALEYEGYAVALAANGEEALVYLRTQPAPCLVLLDLMMPVLNGFEFLEALKSDARAARVPIVIISAASRDQIDAAVKMPGVVGSLIKPVQLEALVQTVARHC